MPTLPTDENTIVDQFVAAIKASELGLKTVEAAAGPIDEILDQLRRYPAVLVLMGRTTFDDGDESGELLEADPTVTLLIGNKSLRSKEEGKEGAHDILKGCRAVLHGKDVGITGTCWTVSEQQPVDLQSGLVVYQQQYKGFNVQF